MNANKDNQNQTEELKKENSVAPETEVIQEQAEETLATVELQTQGISKTEVEADEVEVVEAGPMETAETKLLETEPTIAETQADEAEVITTQTSEAEIATAELGNNAAAGQPEPTVQLGRDKTAGGCLKKKSRGLLKPLLTAVAGLALLGIGIGIGGFVFGGHHGPAHPPAHGPAAEKQHDKEYKHPKPKHEMGEKETNQVPEGMKVTPGERSVGRVDEANPKETQADENGGKMVMIPKAEYDAILKAVKEKNTNQ